MIIDAQKSKEKGKERKSQNVTYQNCRESASSLIFLINPNEFFRRSNRNVIET